MGPSVDSCVKSGAVWFSLSDIVYLLVESLNPVSFAMARTRGMRTLKLSTLNVIYF